MLEIAQEKVERNGWENVTLIQGDAQTVEVPSPLDGVLAFFVPEILISPPARHTGHGLHEPRRQVGGRRRQARAGGSRASLQPLLPGALQDLAMGRGAGCDEQALRKGQPYAALEKAVPRLERQDYMLGCAYIARTVKGR